MILMSLEFDHVFSILLQLFGAVTQVRLLIVAQLVVVLFGEVDLDGSHLVDVGVDVVGCHLEGVPALVVALCDGFGGWAVHVLHVEQIGVQLDVQDYYSAADK